VKGSDAVENRFETSSKTQSERKMSHMINTVADVSSGLGLTEHLT